MEKDYYLILKKHILQKDVPESFIINEIAKDFWKFYQNEYETIAFYRLIRLIELIMFKNHRMLKHDYTELPAGLFEMYYTFNEVYESSPYNYIYPWDYEEVSKGDYHVILSIEVYMS